MRQRAGEGGRGIVGQAVFGVLQAVLFCWGKGLCRDEGGARNGWVYDVSFFVIRLVRFVPF